MGDGFVAKRYLRKATAEVAVSKHRGVYPEPGRSGVVITNHAFEAMWEDAEVGKAAARVPAGWTLRRTEQGWQVIDADGMEQAHEQTLYASLNVAGFAEEV